MLLLDSLCLRPGIIPPVNHVIKLKNKIDIHIQELGGPGSGRRPGDGAGSGSDVGGRVSSLQKDIEKTDVEIKSLDSAASNEEIEQWGDKLESDLGIEGDNKTKAAREIANRERVERKKELVKKKQQLEDDLETEKWAIELETKLGIDPSKTKQYVLPQKGLL
jgi:hypothetical protein